MSLKFQIAARHEFPSDDLGEMHKLRAKVFKERMGWSVSLMSVKKAARTKLITNARPRSLSV